jgi:hypothetical protein
LSESIAETLRVFSADPVPQADLEIAWQRLRINLPPLAVVPEKRAWFLTPRWVWTMWTVATVAVLMVAVGLAMRSHRTTAGDVAVLRPGPLTDKPVDAAIANHLDSAERLLTEVNHTNGPLDDATRSQAHELMVKNAVYVTTAHQRGDFAEAAVLENLGRVLTTLDHEPEVKQNDKSDEGWHVRLSMNTDGLLLDIRILQQNDHDQRQ